MRAAKIDNNQREIVKALRDMGASVQHLHAVGKGCPDILVGYNGRNYLFEIKDGEKKKLTKDQRDFFDNWKGQCRIIRSELSAMLFLKDQDV